MAKPRFYKLKPEVKKKWLAALRSGDYQQVKHKLRVETEDGKPSFCCLGVLCDIYEKEGYTEAQWHFRGERTDDGNRSMQIAGEQTYVPQLIQGWAFEGYHDADLRMYDNKDFLFDNSDKFVKKVEGYKDLTLWKLNDEFNMTFEEIADVIEEKF